MIVGAGSIGGYVGGRLATAGRDVTFLVRPARGRAPARVGPADRQPAWRPDTRRDASHPADALTEPFDIVVLAVKAFALDAALDDLAPAVGPVDDDPPCAEWDEAHGCAGGPLRRVERAGLRRQDHDQAGRGRAASLQLAPLQDFAYGERDGVRLGAR